jgi:hypothetical protein
MRLLFNPLWNRDQVVVDLHLLHQS